MWHAQERFNSYSKPLMNLVSAHILARVRLYLFNSLQFFCLFCKVKTEEHSKLHNATLLRTELQILCWGKFNDFSRIYYKILYKDFSRLCEPYKFAGSKLLIFK